MIQNLLLARYIALQVIFLGPHLKSKSVFHVLEEIYVINATANIVRNSSLVLGGFVRALEENHSLSCL